MSRFDAVKGVSGDELKTNARVRKQAEAAIEEHIRQVIEYFKQDDPVGLPKHLDGIIPDPMTVPPLQQDFSAAKMTFEDIKVHGLSRFRLEHVRSDLSALKVLHVSLSIELNYEYNTYSSALSKNTSHSLPN
jgi:hypothetical protein